MLEGEDRIDRIDNSNAVPETRKNITMDKYMQQDQALEDFQLICMYCGGSRNEAGFWGQDHRPSLPAENISHGICPKCLKIYFPKVYISLCKEGKINLNDAQC